MKATRPWAAYALAAGMVFWAVMALGGGPGLFLSPDGAGMGFDTAWLVHTPFPDYFLPGVILGLLGVATAVVSALVIQAIRRTSGMRERGRRRSASAWRWYYALVVAAGQVGWTAGEIALMWSVVAHLPSSQRTFFYGFWWGFGLLSAANLLLVLALPARRILGGPLRRG